MNVISLDIVKSFIPYMDSKSCINLSTSDRFMYNNISDLILNKFMSDKDHYYISKYFIFKYDIFNNPNTNLESYIKDEPEIIFYLAQEAFNTDNIENLKTIFSIADNIGPNVVTQFMKGLSGINGSSINILYTRSDEHIISLYTFLMSLNKDLFADFMDKWFIYCIYGRYGRNKRKFCQERSKQSCRIFGSDAFMSSLKRHLSAEHYEDIDIIVDIFAKIAMDDISLFRSLINSVFFDRVYQYMREYDSYDIFFSKMLIAVSYYNKSALDIVFNIPTFMACDAVIYAAYDDNNIMEQDPRIISIYQSYDPMAGLYDPR